MTRRRVIVGRSCKSCAPLLLAAVAPVIASLDARADRTYTGQGGFWASPGNWTPSGIPANENVTLQPGTNALVLITYDAAVPATNTSIINLTIDSTTANQVRLQQIANTLTITGAEYVGFNGSGTLNLTGGTHTLSSSGLYLGVNGPARGTVTLG